jgi:hypothetical protein
MSDFEVVPDELRDAPRRHYGSRPSPVARALAEGRTVFVPEAEWPYAISPATSLGQERGALRRRGLRVRSYATERNGQPGWVLWTVPE